MRKALLVCIAIVLLACSQAVNLVSANPWAFSKQIDPPFNASPPIISIDSPKKGTNYSETFNITFTITKPQCNNYVSEIIDATYIIDNQTTKITTQEILGGSHYPPSQYNGSFIAPALAAGNHSLTVRSTGICFQQFGTFFFIDGISQLTFTTGENSTPTPDTTGSSADTAETSASVNLPLIIAITCSVVVAAVASILLVWFKRSKSRGM